ncbi:site-specific integrase [Thermoactinomyces sp. DSM 45892]|uniref:tyrosine-type recombinase/integrase n=1 Tax=Thermoactinomyces sp. DSM 45892 TaxID=1882753 RepID=UPI00089502C5|nr:site-specific integrase [Thermoactinomyces sp. DSM 45892]SDX95904.1 Site-specific recombinase XerD [Thermoactinomyces sp. DSM 45892]
MAQPYRKIENVDTEFWDIQANPYNKELIEEFLSQQHLSPATLKQYTSALKVFAKWIYDFARNKNIHELKPRDALKYQNWLISLNLSSNSIKFKRSAVSSLCGFIELYYHDEHPTFRNIFTKSIPAVPKSNIKEKVPLTIEEIQTLIDELTRRQEWQKIAYICFTYSTGCRREETRQLRTEVATYEKYKEKNFYVSHKIRAKGRGKEGKLRHFAFDERSMKAIQKWLSHRSNQVEQDNCPYVFVRKTKNGYQQISANSFNLWCKEFSEILGGKTVYPHLFRSSRATNAVIEEGKDIQSVQKLLGHESSQTTEIYVVRDDSDDLDDLF